MPKTVRSDWAAQVPAGGIVGEIPGSQLTSIDISKVKAAGFASGKVPIWNGSRFVPTSLPVVPPTPVPPTPTDQIFVGDTPGVAMRMLFGPNQNRWVREVFDIRQYGAMGNNFDDDLGPVDTAIAALNANGSGCLYVPRGTYRLSTAPSPITVPCQIKGDGAGISVFNCAGDGFTGGDSGSWFGVEDISLLSDGSGTTAISLTDGSSAYHMSDGSAVFLSDGSAVGQLFDFRGLQIDGFSTGIAVSGTHRQGFISQCRIFPLSVGLNLNCLGAEVSDVILINAGTTSAVAIALNGDYHSLHGIRIFSGVSNWSKGVTVASGQGIALADMVIYGTQNAAIDLTGAGVARVQNISFGGVLGASPVVFTPSLHYVNELHGLGGNTDTSYDARKELEAQTTWNPSSLNPLESTTIDVAVTGALLSDQVIVGTPDNTDYLQVSARVVATDTVRITLTNMSINVVDLGSGVYKVRVIN